MYNKPTGGWIEVICGSMFSGKTEELIRRLRRARIARQEVQVFKPTIDTRYADREVTSHNGMQIEALPVEDTGQLREIIAPETTVIAIDEAQFFDDDLVEVAELLAGAGKNLIVAGLDLDYLGRPFEPIPSLMLRAEYVTKSLAVCHRCGGPGLFTQRVVASDELVVLGAADAYEARCRRCYDPHEAPQQMLDVAEAP